LKPWAGEYPRRAGVSAFGMGGPNAHVILEEAPPAVPSGASHRDQRLLVLSAKTPTALEAATDRLAAYLHEQAQHPQPDGFLADVEYTLQMGRQAFEYRRTLVCGNVAEAAEALRTRDPKRLHTGAKGAKRRMGFLFPGLGEHYVIMAYGLYREEPVFQESLERCFVWLLRELGLDLKSVLFDESYAD
ncbi:ketoacyl-synthetase C-terminal extension domain-containing protein, partial [Paenibacillus sp. GbtcB18]|uniref:CurL C-terminal domain-containing protein n=1 Tax=Paenibacillus sp. GbtcB18 TaxID=2824763 RepID=UPI00267117DC